MEDIRSFIAIELPEVLRHKLKRLLEEFKDTGADVKWVRLESVHLTLKFLGSVSHEKLEKIATAVRPVVETFEPFQLTAHGIGCFPSSRNPRIVWAGLGEEGGTVARLQREIESKTADLGFPPEERPFRPHLTLGRVRSPKKRDSLVDMIEKTSQIDLGSFAADKVILFRSDLRPEGAIYTKMYEFLMKKKRN